MAASAAGVQQERYAAAEHSTGWHGPVIHGRLALTQSRFLCVLHLLICVAPEAVVLPGRHEHTSAFRSMTCQEDV